MLGPPEAPSLEFLINSDKSFELSPLGYTIHTFQGQRFTFLIEIIVFLALIIAFDFKVKDFLTAVLCGVAWSKSCGFGSQSNIKAGLIRELKSSNQIWKSDRHFTTPAETMYS